MKISWQDGYSVGFELIDQQHKELINRVNLLLTAMSEGKGRGKLDEVLGFIGDYVVTHFKTEEELMLKHKYPGYDAHKAEHTALVKQFLEKNGAIKRSNPTSADVIKTYNWLTAWVVNHIAQTDMLLGPFLKSKNA